jgi:hypothetical protein
MSAPQLHVVWSPRDYHAVFERAATVQAIRAVADEYPREVGESHFLADLVDRELR